MDYPECEMCMYFEYDEEFEEYSCSVVLDEDDYGRFLSESHKMCPYYRGGNEYTIVRKQM